MMPLTSLNDRCPVREGFLPLPDDRKGLELDKHRVSNGFYILRKQRARYEEGCVRGAFQKVANLRDPRVSVKRREREFSAFFLISLPVKTFGESAHSTAFSFCAGLRVQTAWSDSHPSETRKNSLTLRLTGPAG